MRNPIKPLVYWLTRYPNVSKFSMLEYLLYRTLFRHLVKSRLIDGSGAIAKINRADPRTPSKGVYERLICVSGFGNSGSGAVEDLLSEYKDTTSIGYIEPDGSQRERILETDFEFDLLRNPGGLFSFEEILASPFYANGDAAVHRFMSMVAGYCYGYGGRVFGDVFIKAARAFIDEIVEFKNPVLCEEKIARGLRLLWPELDARVGNFYFGLKRMSVSEYRQIAKKFMQTVIENISSKKNLVLDMLLSDGTSDILKYEDYLGPVKIIGVMRDPRDVFAVSRKYGDVWMPKEVDSFISWYRTANHTALRCRHSDFLLVRFTDLALKYDETKSIIEKFLGWTPSMHERPFSGFDPKVSSKNVGLYKQFITDSEAVKIERELSEYLQW